MFHNYETEKITRKASDAAEYIKLFGFSPEIVMHDAFNVIHWTTADIYVSSCMTISGARTEQLVVIGFGELAVVDYNT